MAPFFAAKALRYRDIGYLSPLVLRAAQISVPREARTLYTSHNDPLDSMSSPAKVHGLNIFIDYPTRTTYTKDSQ